MNAKAPLIKPSYLRCDRYNFYNYYGGERNGAAHSTQEESRGFEGIPQNILANIVCWFVCSAAISIILCLFGILRTKAWNYGRIALVPKFDERWSSLFYGDRDAPGSNIHGSIESLDSDIHRQEKGFMSLIPSFFRLRDADIIRKCGSDAMQYLIFQRYLIGFTAIMGLLTIAIILPLNLHGMVKSSEYEEFGTTTIANISKNSPFLWIHFILAFFFFVLSIFCMRHFSVQLKLDRDEHATKTLMITGIPVDKCFENFISKHLTEAYPNIHVDRVQFAFDIRRLMKIDEDRSSNEEYLHNAEEYLQRTGERLRMIPALCGRFLRCCQSCGFNKVDSIDHYQHRVETLTAKFEKEKTVAQNSKIGMAFVTLRAAHEATCVVKDYRTSNKTPAMSSLSGELRASFWHVHYAPRPDDIVWENLSLDKKSWWLKAIGINILVFVLVCSLTTPAYVLNLLNQLPLSAAAHRSNNPLLVEFLPSLILCIVAAALPFLVYYSDQWVGHWTRASEHFWVMAKTFTFLVMMVLILPSLGLTSIPSFINWMLSDKKNSTSETVMHWECVFMPDNSAFFINYIITSAFIGTGLELIRLPELFMYTCRILATRSDAEKSAVKKRVLWEFQFGQSYAWMLCTFSVVSTYSVLSPLIMPFGLLYLILKHMVDRYNLYFAYMPSKISKSIHELAINSMIFGVVLLQVNILAFLAIRLAPSHPLNVVASLSLLIITAAFLARLTMGWFSNLGPIKYLDHHGSDIEDTTLDEGDDGEQLGPNKFEPAVLRKSGLHPESRGHVGDPSSQAVPLPSGSGLVTQIDYGSQNQTGALLG